MNLILEGMVAAPFTPFDDQGNLALSQIPKLANLYVKNGVGGAFICGSTGEGASLTHEEKKQVLGAWADLEDNGLKKIFMVGGTSIREMQSLAMLASDKGLDAVSMLCPYYFKPSTLKSLVDTCTEVASVVPELPFFYYHIPALTGGHFSMHDFLKIADTQIPNLAGIKYTAPDIFDFQKCRKFNDGKYQILWGTDEALLSGLAAGAKGGVGSTYNYAAPLYQRIINAFNSGNINEARQWQDRAVELVDLLLKYGGNEAGKAFMKIIGIDCGWFRTPLKPLTDKQVMSLEQELKEIGFFEFCSKI